MTPIYQLVDELPERSLTTRLLWALDFVMPGKYNNLIGFHNTVKAVTGESDPAFLRKVAERAIALYNDKNEGYQRALWLYQTAETMEDILATAALANKASETWSLLSIFSRITPKSDTAQGIDFATKLVAELSAYCLCNGIPGDSIGDFAAALTNYREEALMRMTALICVDGVIPLGPDFLSKIMSYFNDMGPSGLEKNSMFNRVKDIIPGNSVTENFNFIQQSIDSVSGWMNGFVSQHDLNGKGLLSRIQQFVEVSDDRLDYAAAAIDLTTNTYEHTGTQSVARSIIERAVNEV